MRPLIIGHRGCKGLEPENTLLAIRKAISLNVDAIEIDVRLSKDNELVVIHDSRVDRTTNGKGHVKNLTLREIKKLDAGKGERVPTLQEVIDIIKNKVFLLIELKTSKTEKKVVDLIRKNKIKRTSFVISFMPELIMNVKRLDRGIKTGILFTSRFINPVKKARKTKANLVMPLYKIVNKNFVDRCHKEGIKVFVWNIDNLKELRAYSKLNLDGIGSNRPDILVEYFKKNKQIFK